MSTQKEQDQVGNDPHAGIEKQSSSDTQEVLREIRESNDPAVQQVVQQLGVSFGNSQVLDKVNEEHITATIDIAAAHDERQYKLHTQDQADARLEGRETRWMGFIAFNLLLLFIGVLCVLFKDQPEVLIPVLTGIGGLFAGGLGGYGFGSRNTDR